MGIELIVSHACRMETPLKSLTKGVQRASGLMNTWRSREGGGPGEGLAALSPFPRPHPIYAPLHMAAHLYPPSHLS